MKLIVLVWSLLLFSNQSHALGKKDFNRVIKTIKQKGYYDLSDQEIYQAAISGVLNAIEQKANPSNETLKIMDRSTNVILPPRNTKEMKDELRGEVSGVGVTLNFDREKGHQYPVVMGIIPESGAEKADIKKGDQIVKVDGEPANQFKTFQDLVYKIRGDVDSWVKLKVLRDGEDFEEEIQRKKLSFGPFDVVDSVESAILVEMSYFNEKSTEEFRKVIARAKKEKKTLMIDLRGAPGGLFNAGVDAIKLFSKKGDKILETVRRSGKKQVITATEDGPGFGLDLIILTGARTRSIAEAFAGVLRKNNGAILVGQSTYGKATVESLLKFKSGHSMKFTIGEMNLPGEATWNLKGIQPDIPVSASKVDEKEDPALEVAKRLLKMS